MNGGQQPGGNDRRAPAEAGIRRTIAAWRRLTTPDGRRRTGPGEPTLVALSGGADSSALAIALARAATPRRRSACPSLLVLAHVVHDLRSEQDALRDRGAAAQLAEILGLPFVEARVRCRTGEGESRDAGQPGNLEARARAARYGALARLAREAGTPFIATAHHADDQLETLLMGLLRGSNLSGFRGIAVTRALAPDLQLIRPLLAARLDRAACEAICASAGWRWADDASNRDLSRLRAAVRATVVPAMKALRPGVARLACTAGELGHQHQAVVEHLLSDLRERAALDDAGDCKTSPFTREYLRDQPPFMIGELLRGEALELNGWRGADAMTARALTPIIRAVRDRCTDPRTFALGPVDVHITARAVTVRRRQPRDLPSPP